MRGLCRYNGDSDSSTAVGHTYPYLLVHDDTCLAGETKAVRGESAWQG